MWNSKYLFVILIWNYKYIFGISNSQFEIPYTYLELLPYSEYFLPFYQVVDCIIFMKYIILKEILDFSPAGLFYRAFPPNSPEHLTTTYPWLFAHGIVFKRILRSANIWVN